MHSTYSLAQKAFMVSWGSTCSLLLLDVNRFILTVSSAWVNHPFIISQCCENKPGEVKHKHPIPGTAQGELWNVNSWAWNVNSWDWHRGQAWHRDHLTETKQSCADPGFVKPVLKPVLKVSGRFSISHWQLHNPEESGTAAEAQPWSLSCCLPSPAAPHTSRKNHNSGFIIYWQPPTPAAGDKPKLKTCFQGIFQSWNLPYNAGLWESTDSALGHGHYSHFQVSCL